MKGLNRTRLVLIAALCAVVVAVFANCAIRETEPITVGFIYDNDETTPYSYNFYLAQKSLHDIYGDRVKAIMFSNVLEEELEDPVGRLAKADCDIVFTNNYGNMLELARRYPDIQFCQTSHNPYPEEDALSNYHTFKGEIYQARYVSGIVAGLKLQQLIDEQVITPDEALVGFVGAYPYPEVISGYTAFLLGVRSVVPEATMRVKYTNTWGSFTLEKACAAELLDEGCIVISQHTDTVGPAIACEECYDHEAYHVGYNIDMTDVAPNTSLTSARINWTPYVVEAVRAVMENKPIEQSVPGNVHAQNDMSAGFDLEWVELTQLNEKLLPEGTRERVNEAIKALRDGNLQVFIGDYRGASPTDPSDTVDLSEGFEENKDSSIPAFHYVLDDVVVVED